jgi:hypothetical protein
MKDTAFRSSTKFVGFFSVAIGTPTSPEGLADIKERILADTRPWRRQKAEMDRPERACSTIVRRQDRSRAGSRAARIVGP